MCVYGICVQTSPIKRVGLGRAVILLMDRPGKVRDSPLKGAESEGSGRKPTDRQRDGEEVWAGQTSLDPSCPNAYRRV